MKKLERILFLCAKELLARSEELSKEKPAKVKRFSGSATAEYPNCQAFREPKVYHCNPLR